ncbi:hypothetical protein JAAARDRAFT_208336 [Jaapia argillacea MUCL 33604]|uniref:Lariat debranching enzyme C-terminal domain-containing protein n=1 Tax=Jaapia argillacea MUCL 33604 TaxID=933084 RepID=A0A067PQP6_9AGAM|nr:hypothetical protein JAAARDRAFT_208336 [Jaapia argillacea MUCL 33604]
MPSMKIAVEGCCHGELPKIYSEIQHLERQNNYKVDLLLVCGDFQAIRNERDLQCLAVPDKYRKLGEFYKYYTGEEAAPVLTIVIGGNHEASNFFWELYHGGWLASNIYFLGHAGCVQVNGVRIAGASGIFKGFDFKQGHWEKLPYDRSSMRSIYHIREFNVRRLSLLSTPSIFLSHDWPASIEHYGNLPSLLRMKKFLRQDIDSGKLGSPPMWGLLTTLKPDWWFAAHLHVRYEAAVRHGPQGGEDGGGEEVEGVEEGAKEIVKEVNPDEIVIDDDEDFADPPVAPTPSSAQPSKPAEPVPAAQPPQDHPPINPDEITIDEEEEEVIRPPPPPVAPERPQEPKVTKFLALDKCLPNRHFLEVIDIPISTEYASSSPQSSQSPKFTFDPEWLAITRAFHPWLSTGKTQPPFPDEKSAREMVREEMEWVRTHVYGIKGQWDGEGGGKAGSSDDMHEDKGKGKQLDTSFVGLEKLLKEITDCQVFSATAPPPDPQSPEKGQQPPFYPNPQTEAFCSMLGIQNKIVR